MPTTVMPQSGFVMDPSLVVHAQRLGDPLIIYIYIYTWLSMPKDWETL